MNERLLMAVSDPEFVVLGKGRPATARI